MGSRLQKQFPVPWKIHSNSCIHRYLTRRNPKIIKKNPPLSMGGFMYNLFSVCMHITRVNREYLFWRTLREIGHARRATFHYFHGEKHALEIYVGKAEKCEECIDTRARGKCGISPWFIRVLLDIYRCSHKRLWCVTASRSRCIIGIFPCLLFWLSCFFFILWIFIILFVYNLRLCHFFLISRLKYNLFLTEK